MKPGVTGLAKSIITNEKQSEWSNLFDFSFLEKSVHNLIRYGAAPNGAAPFMFFVPPPPTPTRIARGKALHSSGVHSISSEKQ